MHLCFVWVPEELGFCLILHRVSLSISRTLSELQRPFNCDSLTAFRGPFKHLVRVEQGKHLRVRACNYLQPQDKLGFTLKLPRLKMIFFYN